MSQHTFKQNQAFFRELLNNQEYTDFKDARTGKLASNGTVISDPSYGLGAGYIWIRLLPGRAEVRAIIGAGMRGFERIADLLVTTAINAAGERVCIRPLESLEGLNANAAALETVIGSNYIDTTQLSFGLVTADTVTGYGLSVYVQPFVYRDRVVSGSVAITAPAVAGTRRMSVVYYDYGDDALGVAYGTASGLDASSWRVSDAVAVALGGTDRIRLGAVLVANGDTSITPTDSYRFFDCRDWLTLDGSSSGAGDSLQMALTAQVFG